MDDVPADTLPPDTRLSPDEPTRRGFYIAAINGLMAIITAAVGIPALLYLFVPAKLKKSGAWTEAGDTAHLQPNSPVEVTFHRERIDGWRTVAEKGTAWVVKFDDNRIVAYGPNCTHLGCAYHWEAGKKDFFCPCHNSAFSIDGKVLEGPAPRPLDRYQTKLEGTKLLLGELKKSGESQS